MGVKNSVISTQKLTENITSETTCCAWFGTGLSNLYLKRLFGDNKKMAWVGPMT